MGTRIERKIEKFIAIGISVSILVSIVTIFILVSSFNKYNECKNISSISFPVYINIQEDKTETNTEGNKLLQNYRSMKKCLDL